MTLPAPANDATDEVAAPPGTHSARIVGALRDAIVRLDYKPGDALSEAEIGARFGVSRQPVREAFIKLAGSGLLLIRPRRATRVVQISERLVLEARFLREALEVEIVRRAAADPLPGYREVLDREIDAQEAAAARGDAVAFHAADERFHHAVARMVGLGFAWELIDAQKMQLDRVRFMTLTPGMAETIREHRAMADAVLAGRAAEAEAVLRHHLGKIEALLAAAKAIHPDYFADPVPGRRATTRIAAVPPPAAAADD